MVAKEHGITTETVTFDALVQGRPDEQFDTLQSAMEYFETLDTPTGFIGYNGQMVLAYTDGAVDFAT